MPTSFSEAFEKVKALVDTFNNNYTYYKSATYMEAEVRSDFIDPFFKALGWDVNHKYQTNPYKQEVKVEKSQKQEGSRSKKFADYAFYLEPNFKNPVFFVEAKKPAVLLENNTQYYHQTHKYGWNSQTPLAILTDFEEFIVIDCRDRPHPKFSAKTAVKKYNFNQYKDEEVFREIYYLFSREALLDDSINHFVETQIPKRKIKERQTKLFGGGYKAVDDDFLEYIDQLRLDLAKAFFRNNSNITPKELTEATQKTIDRLVFIRFLEDKQIEFEDHIYEIKKWKNFIQLSQSLDAKYNGIVFKPSIIDKKDFKGADDDIFYDICQDISSKETPYNFNVIPIHILGSIYERFLGKVVTTENGIVDIQPKPEVRKAGGVYYTPQYIVNYIIENSIGKIIKGKSPKEIDNLQFADISSGSGSFLIGVYESLIDYHKNYYQEKLQDKTELDGRSDDIDNVTYYEGRWVLTLKRKQEILLNNVFGVDIDNQAVEVSQLSLFLKLLEDESFGTTRTGQGTLFTKVLPDLTGNIKSGNSLVGWDILENNGYTIEEQKEINPFDFRSAFPQVFKDGGFDALVGNPPYVKEYTSREAFEAVKKSYLKEYYQGKMDLWYFFVCNGLDLLKKNGLLGYIIPNNWTTNSGASIMRNKIISDSQIVEMIDFSNFMVFDSASIQTMIFILEKSQKNKTYSLEYLKLLKEGNTIDNAKALLKREKLDSSYILKTKLNREKYKNEYILFGNKDVNTVLKKIEKCKNFEFKPRQEVAQGIVTPQDAVNRKSSKKINIPVGKGVFILSKDELKELRLNKEEQTLIKPIYNSSQIEKYYTHPENKYWIIYTDSSYKQENSLDNFPKIKEHLDKYKEIITSSNKPYGLHRARNEKFFKGEKIISLRKCSEHPVFSYSKFDTYVTQTYYVIKTKRIELKYLIGILNSKMVKFWLLHKGKMQGSNFQIDKEPILDIPIFKANNKTQRKVIIDLVDNMIKTRSDKRNISTSAEEDFFERKINAIDAQINAEVYSLYNLDEEDIATIKNI